MNITAGSLGGLHRVLSKERLEIVSLAINDRCNLSCRHCYLESRSEPVLSRDEWARVFESLLVHVQPRVLCIAGKEPFLDREGAGLVKAAVRCRNESQGVAGRTRVGAITNGTRHGAYEGLTVETAPDFIDISLDGLPKTHDSIRGTGAFRQSSAGLARLMRLVPDRVWVLFTLCAANAGELAEFVALCRRDFGVARFSIGVYEQLDYTAADLRIEPKAVATELASQLRKLGEDPSLGDIRIQMELGIRETLLRAELQSQGFIRPQGGLFSQSHSLTNGATVDFHVSDIPTGLWRSVRISSSGEWISAEDLTNVRRYREKAVLNLRDLGYDAGRAASLSAFGRQPLPISRAS